MAGLFCSFLLRIGLVPFQEDQAVLQLAKERIGSVVGFLAGGGNLLFQFVLNLLFLLGGEFGRVQAVEGLVDLLENAVGGRRDCVPEVLQGVYEFLEADGGSERDQKNFRISSNGFLAGRSGSTAR